MWPQLTNLLPAWQWVVLGLLPPVVIALYFLKLKRVPLEVPSTYLWKKSIEDLHVNSLWQRLRRSILLLLQLLLLLIILLALLNFSWRDDAMSEQRTIYLIDNSASMQTKDADEGKRTRLEESKRRVADAIANMKSGDTAMIISFSDTAQVVQQYTGNRPELKRQLASIQPTNQPTSILDALRLASGLANPGRSGFEGSTDLAAAEAVPATLEVYSDFRFSTVSDFALGNLEPKLESIGDPQTKNVAIVNFSTGRHEDRPDMIHTFGKIQNYSPEEITVRAELLLDGFLVDAADITIEAGGFGHVDFSRDDVETGVLELRVNSTDTLAVDDHAWTVINRPEPQRVLFISKGNDALERAFESDAAAELAEIELADPAHMDTEEFKTAAAGGLYNLIIFDECRPKTLPACNTLFINALPPDGRWKLGEKITTGVQIIDTETTHPLMSLLDLSDVAIYHATVVQRPSGGVNLIDAAEGPVFAIAPRDGFEDAVLGFSLGLIEEEGQLWSNTDWPTRWSYPVFIKEMLTYLGGAEADNSSSSIPPGRTYQLRGASLGDELTVVDPSKQKQTVRRNRQNQYEFTDTREVGIYQIFDGDELVQQFAVNLFDSAESDNRTLPDVTVQLGHVEVTAGTSWQPTRREIWKWLVALGLVVLLLEWYIYNRRVYL